MIMPTREIKGKTIICLMLFAVKEKMRQHKDFQKGFILFILPSILSIALASCKNQDVINDLQAGVIENRTFNATLLIDGTVYDGTIIRNCTFENIEGDGLQIRDVNALLIENCIFRDISGNAIRFRNSGISDGVEIIENQIYNIEKNGILAPENHINTRIHKNEIYNVAINNTSSQFGAPHHGIYFQGFNVRITENSIYKILNDQGNAEELLIENNVIYDNGKRGINLASNGNKANHIGNAVIRFNTVVSSVKSVIGINDELSGVNFDIAGNILIKTDGGSNYIFSGQPYTESYNITASGDIGFIDFDANDMRILSSSQAANAAVGLMDFPDIDYLGKSRIANSLDVGAYAD